ncbi:methylmalonyl-CoA mutase subunit beta [Myroides sp. LJL116]
MNNELFEDFPKVSSKEWKNLIQFDLKGAEYNQTLVWESLEDIKVRPFYQNDVDNNPLPIPTQSTEFAIVQQIYVFDVSKTIEKTQQVLEKGAEIVHFTIDNAQIEAKTLLEHLPKEAKYLFNFNFLELDYIKDLSQFAKQNNYDIQIILDPLKQLQEQGNWFSNLTNDFEQLNEAIASNDNIYLGVNTSLHQNAGANIVQQVSYALAQVSEYLHRVKSYSSTIFIQVSVGSNYFFEIAKLRALRMLLDVVGKEFNSAIDFKIMAIPSKRNKTLYDYNVNLLRTTTESMSAILGGADYVSNLAYDAIYHKENEFSDRIARNQLLILKQESYFNAVNNPCEGAYYIEYLTAQIAQKALDHFKKMERNDGLITLLIQGVIQKEIAQNANKEQELFEQGKEVLLGSNKYPNANDFMSDDLELYPFVKQNPRKTLIIPIIEKRLAQQYEKDRLELEKNKNN